MLLYKPHTKGGLVLVSREKVLLKIRGGDAERRIAHAFFSSEINVSKERKNERTFESSRFEIVDFQIRNGLNCRRTPAPTPSDPRGSEIFDLSRSSIFK